MTLKRRNPGDPQAPTAEPEADWSRRLTSCWLSHVPPPLLAAGSARRQWTRGPHQSSAHRGRRCLRSHASPCAPVSKSTARVAARRRRPEPLNTNAQPAWWPAAPRRARSERAASSNTALSRCLGATATATEAVTLVHSLVIEKKIPPWRCALACERLRCEPWRPWVHTKTQPRSQDAQAQTVEKGIDSNDSQKSALGPRANDDGL